MNNKFNLSVISLLSLILLFNIILLYKSLFTNFIFLDFAKNNEDIKKDLLNKTVVINHGETWSFTEDQLIDLDLVNKKIISNDLVLAVCHLKSSTNVLFDDKNNKENLQSKNLYLNGMVKIYYEKHNGNWYLTLIENINLSLSFDLIN